MSRLTRVTSTDGSRPSMRSRERAVCTPPKPPPRTRIRVFAVTPPSMSRSPVGFAQGGEIPPKVGIQAVATMTNALDHWVEYLAEATCLGLFMVSAAAFATLLQHPGVAVGTDVFWRAGSRAHGHRDGRHGRGTDLLAVGPLPGAHMNPAVTLTFWRLGKIASADAGFLRRRAVPRWCSGIALATWILRGLPGTARSTTSRRRARRASASPSPLRPPSRSG